jgi:hypothetical protein
VSLKQDREFEETAKLVQSPAARQVATDYTRALERYWTSGAATPPSPAKMKALVEAEGLDCDAQDYDTDFASCHGHGMVDDSLLAVFWTGLVAAVACFALWLFVLFRESWMLPRWTPHVWYTPAYALALAAIASGPFLMLEAFRRRADSAYFLEPDRWTFTEPGTALFLVLVLQLTAVCIAAVELRPSGVRFLITTLVFVVVTMVLLVAGILAATLTRLDGELWLGLLVLFLAPIATLLGVVAWQRRRRRMAGRARSPFVRRILQLSPVLGVAWVLVGVDGALRAADESTAALHTVLVSACYAVCVVHLVRSRSDELRRMVQPRLG